MRLLPRAALTAALLSFAAIAPAAASAAEFQTPSGNIACGLFDSHSTGSFVRCDIEHRDWALPPKPKRPGCSELDFGGDLEVTATGKGHFICAGDTILHQGPRLAYGHHRTVGRFTCTSRTSGVTCRNRRNGHGFFLSRGSYRRF
jgi:hypothetical protein